MIRFSSLSVTALLAMLLVGGPAVAQEPEEADEAQQIQQNEEAQQTEAREDEATPDDPADPEAREELPAPPGIERERDFDRFEREQLPGEEREFDRGQIRRDPEQRPALGVRLHPQAPGLMVQQVVPGSPAAEAGLQPGDQIMTMNETQYADAQAFVTAIGEMEPGTEITLQIQRAGQPQDLSMELGTWQQVFAEREQEFGQDPGFPQQQRALRPQFNGADMQQMRQEIQQLRQTVQQLQREVQQLRQQNGVERPAPIDRPVPAPADDGAPALPPTEVEPTEPAEGAEEQADEDEEDET